MPHDRPTFVAIGHISWDTTPEQPNARQPGGAAAYAAIVARRLGNDAALITAAAPNDGYPLDEVAPQDRRRVRTSNRTTTFENSHITGDARHQRLLARADDILESDVPTNWRRPDILFVGPLAHELAPDCLNWFQPQISCVVPQGWCRRWSHPLPANVEVRQTPPAAMSTNWDICVISEHETNPDTLPDWQAVSEHLVVTRGAQGATLYRRGDAEGTPVAPVIPDGSNAVVDTTGAGDVFAAAMAVHYAQHTDPTAAAAFGAEWAARCITAPSWQGIA